MVQSLKTKNTGASLGKSFKNKGILIFIHESCLIVQSLRSCAIRIQSVQHFIHEFIIQKQHLFRRYDVILGWMGVISANISLLSRFFNKIAKLHIYSFDNRWTCLISSIVRWKYNGVKRDASLFEFLNLYLPLYAAKVRLRSFLDWAIQLECLVFSFSSKFLLLVLRAIFRPIVTCRMCVFWRLVPVTSAHADQYNKNKKVSVPTWANNYKIVFFLLLLFSLWKTCAVKQVYCSNDEYFSDWYVQLENPSCASWQIVYGKITYICSWITVIHADWRVSMSHHSFPSAERLCYWT